MKTEIIAILDRSGSMNSIVDDAIGGFNSFLESQKNQEGDAKISLILFDHDYQLIYQGGNIKEVPKLDSNTFIPRGRTALLDAIGRTIYEQRARIEREAWADQVIVCILTDGMENSSKEFKSDQIKNLITKLQNENEWEFIYLAANQDAFAVGRQYGISAKNTANFTASSVGTQQAFETMSEDTTIIRKRKNRENN